MKKMKKLLSVILAVVLALSCMSVMASAAKTNYKTVANLESLAAYSPYGQVTRLSIEERTSIVFDFVDNLLPGLNINMGEVFNVLGLSVTIDLTSIDRLCYSFDTIKSTFENGLAQFAMGIVDLGILESLETGKWVAGMSRDGTAQYTILSTILNFLSDNTTLVGKVFTDGLDLGLVSLGDMSAVEEVIGDLPGLIKGLIFPLLERWDDTLTEVKNYDTWSKGNGNVSTALDYRIKALFTDDMSITTVKYDKDGKMTSEHTKMPFKTTAPATGVIIDANAPRCYYQITGTTPGSTMTVYHLVDAKEAKDLAKTPDEVNGSPAAYTYFKEKQTYTMAQEVEGGDTYVWQATDEWGNKWSMKWYNDDSQFLPSFAESGKNIELVNNSVSAGDLLYTMIPYVFEEMAPVVLNGSLKKILAEFFGAQFTYVGQGGPEADEAVMALADSSNAFFTQKQGEYLWEWSDYAVINGNHYYRFEDQIFKADLSYVNNYFYIIDYGYEITGDFMNEFIPANDDNANVRMLQNVNNFLIKVAEEITVASAATVDHKGFEKTWTRPTFTKGGNENLVANLKLAAQTVISLAPQHIFGSDYDENDRCYYDLLMSSDDATVLTGIAATIVDMVMPTMYLPGADALVASNAKVGSILAAVIREFAASLVPEYNYDALIYTDYGVTTSDKDKTFLAGKDSGYWLDVIMTMALDVGYEYLRAFADLGEDQAECAGAVNTGYGVDGKTYAAGTTQAALNAQWEGMLDYIIDWALDKDYEWTWKMENIVETTGFTVDLTTAQDPWVKLDAILFGLIPFDEILTITPTDCDTKLEQFLRYDLILGIVDLEWDHLIDTVQLNGTNKYFRTGNIANQLASLLKKIVNGIFDKPGGGSFALIPSAITTFDTLANQDNLVAMIKSLVGVLHTALVTNKLAETAFPILNFFLGWTTNPQKIADPQITTTFRDNEAYAFQWTGQSGYPAIDGNATYLTILNNSSGMLEKHRGSDVTDHAYDINIKSVTSDATVNTLTFTVADSVLSPYEKTTVKIGGTYKGEEAVTVTVEFDYVGKDGQPVGGTQYTSITFFISNQYQDANISGLMSGDNGDGHAIIQDFKTFVFTEDVYEAATTYQPSIAGDNDTFAGTSKFKSVTAPDGRETDCNGNETKPAIDMTGYGAQYFDYYQNQDGGWASSFPKDGSTSGKLYKPASGVTAETEFPFGVYDMGQVAVKYGDDSKVWVIDFIHYDDYDIDVMWNDYKTKGLTKYSVDTTDAEAVAAYNAYNTALKNVAKLATYPKMTSSRNTINGSAVGTGVANTTDYVTGIMPKIEDAKTALEEAYKTLEGFMANAQGSAGADAALPAYVTALEAQLATDDVANNTDIDYVDYAYYEYFNYADLRTEARNLVKTYYAPEIMDTYYILNSGIREAELNNVIAAEENKVIAAAIEATKLQNDQAAIDASIAARNDWKMPVNTKLFVEDMTARLAYYKTFLAGNEEPDAHLTFLAKEIDHVEAQQFAEADYTVDSWARYAEALAAAKEIEAAAEAGNERNSDIYEAKRELMIARKNLLKKADSLIEAGGTDALEANITKAEEIFGMALADIELSEAGLALAENADDAKKVALGHLLQGLGYYYTGEDGNEWNLYADSAYEYADNDRPNRQSNQNKVDGCNANLEACLAYFAAEEVEITFEGKADTTGVVDVTSEEGAELQTGYIYGITAGDDVENYITYENCYVEYVASTLSANGTVNGTGALVKTYTDESKAEQIGEYTVIVFGDLSGDASITATDVSAAKSITQNVAYSDAVMVAADVTGANDITAPGVTAADLSTIKGYTQNAVPTVNPYA